MAKTLVLCAFVMTFVSIGIGDFIVEAFQDAVNDRTAIIEAIDQELDH